MFYLIWSARHGASSVGFSQKDDYANTPVTNNRPLNATFLDHITTYKLLNKILSVALLSINLNRRQFLRGAWGNANVVLDEELRHNFKGVRIIVHFSWTKISEKHYFAGIRRSLDPIYLILIENLYKTCRYSKLYVTI